MNMLSRNSEEHSSKKQLTEFKVIFLDSLGVGIKNGEDVPGNALPCYKPRSSIWPLELQMYELGKNKKQLKEMRRKPG